jgi:hypothetical protein
MIAGPSPASSHDRLIGGLVADLRPVRRLWPPAAQAVLWLAAVAAMAGILAAVSNPATVATRLAAAPDMWLATLGSFLTTVLAALAAFQLSFPDRKQAWALLPIPTALLWIGASGAGCLRTWLVPGTHVAGMQETGDCLLFILAVSVPLSILLIGMLRRACPLQPGLTTMVAGLAAAAAAATLLNFYHPYDASATDLVVHMAAVALVIVGNRVFAGRILRIAPVGGS